MISARKTPPVRPDRVIEPHRENCVASCAICNNRKADRLLEELGWTLAVPPVVPRGAHWRLVGAHYDGDPQWAAYLRESSAA